MNSDFLIMSEKVSNSTYKFYIENENSIRYLLFYRHGIKCDHENKYGFHPWTCYSHELTVSVNESAHCKHATVCVCIREYAHHELAAMLWKHEWK